jgi:replicative DNA helicase
MDEPTVLHDDDAERIVLGALMVAPALADALVEKLRSSDFARRAHGVIYAHLVARLAAGEPVEPVAVMRGLAAAGELATIGGAAYLHTLVASVPTAANAGYYADIVADHAVRRRMVEVGQRIVQWAQSPDDVAEIANRVQQAALDATAPRQRQSVSTLAALIDEEAAELLAEDGPKRGLSTGLGSLDGVIGGLKRGQLILVAGRPGAGKSVLCLDMARASIRRGAPTLFASLEMPRREILARIFAAEAEVNLYRLLNGGLRDDERARVDVMTQVLRPRPLHVEATPSADLATIRSSARRIKARQGLGLIVVDYLQLMATAGRENRVQELGAISRGLKVLAGDLGVPIVAAAQLNRAGEIRSDKRPQLSDLRESGSLEQDADVVLLIHRPDYYDQEHARAGEVDLIIAKNRNGPQDTVTAFAQLAFARFVDIGVPA